MVDLQQYNSIDDALLASSKLVKPEYYITPKNEDEREQKEAFLAGKIQTPCFVYRELEYDPNKVIDDLNSCSIPNDELGNVLRGKRNDVLLENLIILNRGNSDVVKRSSVMLYGSPSSGLVLYAEGLARELHPEEAVKDVPAEEIKSELEKALQSFGLEGWSVELSDKRLTTLYPAEKKMTVCKDRKFSEAEKKKLVVHEVGVHILRAANGYEQPLKIFATGLPGYLPTEEGLTSYFEEVTGCSSNEVMRDYAGRVIAVDSVYKDLSFSQTFERLRSFGFSEDQSWNLSVRAHRGGGYIKDHVYLSGYKMIKEFAQQNGDFRTLYTGKIGIFDLDLVKMLIEKGVLKAPKHLPWFVS